MSFDLTGEQALLRDTLENYLADSYGFAARRTAMATPRGWRTQCWREFADDLGILGAGFPEELGGLGGGSGETLVIMEAFGRFLVTEPYLATVVIGGGFLKYGGGACAPDLIARIIAGEAILAFAHTEDQAGVTARLRPTGGSYVLRGEKTMVRAGPSATHFVVTARTGGDAGGISVFVIDRATTGISTRDFSTYDGQRAALVRFDDVVVSGDCLIGEESQGLPLVERVIDEATVALCAEAVGIQRKLLEDTIAYAKQRRQFGRPIAAFQVLQHRMADMMINLERSAAITALAAHRLDAKPVERALAVSAAKVTIGQSCRFAGQWAVHIHGGMGLSDEMPVSHYFKRATMIEGELGTTGAHLARYEKLRAL